jgi:hypothetical protein
MTHPVNSLAEIQRLCSAPQHIDGIIIPIDNTVSLPVRIGKKDPPIMKHLIMTQIQHPSDNFEIWYGTQHYLVIDTGINMLYKVR